MAQRVVFAVLIVLATTGIAEAQSSPIKIAEVNADGGGSNSGGIFPPTLGTRFILRFSDGPSLSSPLLPSPLAISNVTFQIDRDNTPGFDDFVALLTDGIDQPELQTSFIGVVEPGTPYGEGFGTTGGSPEAIRLGRTRDLQGFEIAFLRLVVAHASAIFGNGPDGDGFSIDVQAVWEVWGNPIGNSPPVADAGPDQILVAAGSYPIPVSLNGSASDPDSDPIAFFWTGPFGTVTGRTPSVALLPGVYDVVLTASDDRFGVSTDSVRIIIRDAIADLSSQIASQCTQSGGGTDVAAALSALTTQVAQCQQLIGAGQLQLAGKDVELNALRGQLQTAQQQIFTLTQQLALVGAAINSIERSYQMLVPSFDFPGTSDIDRLNSLIGVLLSQQVGQQRQIIEALAP